MEKYTSISHSLLKHSHNVIGYINYNVINSSILEIFGH